MYVRGTGTGHSGRLSLAQLQAPPRARRGFTLVEILVTVALLGIVSALLIVPLVSTFQYFRSATARADAQSVARMALDSMARELAEAMYVQLDMYDNSMIALTGPVRVDPDDPNSEIATPPRPDWDHAIRFWRALYDPTRDYYPAGQYAPENTFYLARTEVEAPGSEDDAWNRWNQEWADGQNEAGADGIYNWSPVSRVVHTDVDWRRADRSVGIRNSTLQPGFPYLRIQYQLAEGLINDREAARLYRDLAVALTPSSTQYDVTRLEFTPTVVSGEWLQLTEGASGEDKSVYQSQFPLWRLGAKYTGWAALSGETYLEPALEAWGWARDPFLLIYRYQPDDPDNPLGRWSYGLYAVGAFDPRTRTLKVMDPEQLNEVYDSDEYPYRSEVAWAALGVDWTKGALLCAFPPPGDRQSMWQERPIVLPNEARGLTPVLVTLPDPIQTVVDVPLWDWWLDAGGAPITHFVLPDSVRVRIDIEGDGVVDRALTQVYSTPRDYSDQFQLRRDPGDPAPGTEAPAYGWIRLPGYLGDGTQTDGPSVAYYVDFRWRNNGVWIDGREYTDRVSAYYRTAAVLDISIGVRKAGMRARRGEQIAQAVNMTRRVKLRNALREIRYAEE